MLSMDQAGLINSIAAAAINIDKGRKNLTLNGFEHAGRVFYEDGISSALDIFANAQVSADPQTMIVSFDTECAAADLSPGRFIS